MEERLSKLGRMTRKVTASNPQEGRQVQARHSEITGLWDKLKVCMKYHNNFKLYNTPIKTYLAVADISIGC